MICKNCGAQNSDGSSFCSNCGAKLDVQPQSPVIPLNNGQTSDQAVFSAPPTPGMYAQQNVPEPKKKKKKGCLIAFLVVLAFIVILFFIAVASSPAIDPDTTVTLEATTASDVTTIAEAETTASETVNTTEAKTTEKATEPTTEAVSLEFKNALRKAESYISFSGFSKKGLKEQLEFEGFSDEACEYAVNNCSADWNEQAAKKAKSYLDFSSFSRQGLYEQLEYEGFTAEQIEYGLKAVGY